MEEGAGELSNHLDEEYEGVNFCDAQTVLEKTNLLLTVQPITEEQSNLLNNDHCCWYDFWSLKQRSC